VIVADWNCRIIYNYLCWLRGNDDIHTSWFPTFNYDIWFIKRLIRVI
jgi:hypothetical protein